MYICIFVLCIDFFLKEYIVFGMQTLGCYEVSQKGVGLVWSMLCKYTGPKERLA